VGSRGARVPLFEKTQCPFKVHRWIKLNAKYFSETEAKNGNTIRNSTMKTMI